MKKFILITILLSLLAGRAFCQANKPEVGAFGLKASVSIPKIGTGLTFSRQWKKNLEYGANVRFSFRTIKYTSATWPIEVNSTDGSLNANTEYSYRYSNYTVALSPFLVYHLPLKSNLDVFTGVRLSFSVGRQINDTFFNRVYTTNYESKENINTSFPFSFGVGPGILLGVDYYFRKNMAIGVSGDLGLSSYHRYGTFTEQVTHTNTGSLNPTQGTTYSERQGTWKDFSYTNIGLISRASVNFTFFFTRHEEKKYSTKSQP